MNISVRKVQDIELAESIDDISDYNIINQSCEIFDRVGGVVIAKFEKNILPLMSFNELDEVEKICKLSRTRGLSAGKPNSSLEYYKSYKNGKPAPDRAIRSTKGKNYMILKGSVKTDGKRAMEINNPVYSSAVGYYPNTNSSNLSNNKEKFRLIGGDSVNKLMPYTCAVDKAFELLLPEHWTRQFIQAQTHINLFNTGFTTITINKNFTTAVHRDKGNVPNFFSGLVVASQGKYEGGYLLLPEYKIGFNITDTDILLFNPQIKHCNSKIYETEEQKKYNKHLGLKPTLVNGKPYITGDELAARRYSFVFYQREGF